jgi:hypothetical protein
MEKMKRLYATVIRAVFLIVILLQTNGATGMETGSTHPVSSPSVTVESNSVLEENDPQLRPPKQQAELPALSPAPVVIAAATAILLMLLWEFIKKRRHPPSPSPGEARDVPAMAVNDLDMLIAGGRPAQEEAKHFYTLLSEIIKRTLKAAGILPAVELTTDEIVGHLQSRQNGTEDAALIASVLKDCDIVKFAGYVPGGEHHAAVVEKARQIVTRARELSRADR